MKIAIKGLAEIRARLDQVRPAEIMASALADQAEQLAQNIRDALSEPQGGGDHDKPWLRTGALRDSIAVTAQGLEAAIGSNDPAAAPQEMGTSRIPPRPFLAPAASANGENLAKSIADRLAAALGDITADPRELDAPTSNGSMPADAPLKMPAEIAARSELYIGTRNDGSVVAKQPAVSTSPKTAELPAPEDSN